MKDSLLLIDAYSQIFRCFYGVRSLTNSRGEPTNALLPFARLLLKLRTEFPAGFGALVFDCGKVQFRMALNPEYKANRPPAPEELKQQIPVIREMASALGWPLLEEPEYEADDLIAALATAHGGNVRIISSDKDLVQLVNDRITILVPDRKNGWEVRDPAGALEKFAVRPDQIIDYLALLGDAADNIPGVRGIGVKTAAELLQAHDSVDAMLQNPEIIASERIRKLLLDGAEIVQRNRDLIRLRRDLPGRFVSPASCCVLRDPDWNAFRDLVERMELKSLLKEIPEQKPAEPEMFQGDLFG